MSTLIYIFLKWFAIKIFEKQSAILMHICWLPELSICFDSPLLSNHTQIHILLHCRKKVGPFWSVEEDKRNSTQGIKVIINLFYIPGIAYSYITNASDLCVMTISA